MENPNIYLVGGAGAGKTYLSKYLIKNHGYTHSKMANSVYMIAEKYFGMNPDKKDRQLLQSIGTDVGRMLIDRDIWINRLIDDVWIAQRTAEDFYNKELTMVLDDCRFENEHLALKEADWVGIYLDVSDEIRLQRLVGRDGDAQVNTLQHESETALYSFKDELIKVDVSGSLEKSYQNLEETLEYIRKEVIK